MGGGARLCFRGRRGSEVFARNTRRRLSPQHNTPTKQNKTKQTTPSNAYVFSELVEWHATDTYAEFVDANADLLKSLPPPAVAAAYYRNEDLYFFDEMQQAAGVAGPDIRRPECNDLYDGERFGLWFWLVCCWLLGFWWDREPLQITPPPPHTTSSIHSNQNSKNQK